MYFPEAKINLYFNHSMQIFLPFHWPRTHHLTYKYLPTNNGLLMRNAVQLCLAANNIIKRIINLLPWIHPDHVHHQNQEVQLGPDT